MANECIPLYRPGFDVPTYAPSGVDGCRLAEVVGLRDNLPSVRTCPTGGAAFGVAVRDSDARSALVTVMRGPNVVAPVVAGMSPAYESLTDVSEKLFDTVLNLNLKGPFRLSALAGERMVAAGGGVIINVSTKAGLNALTEGLAKAYGPTVRVNTLMPGPFLTDISKAWNLDSHAGKANPFAGYALRRAGEPAEIVGAALFLMSDASSYTTGSILHADGGFP